MKSDLPNQRYASVWDALEDTPQAAEQMKLRSALMMALEQHITAKSWTHDEAAQRMGVARSQVSALVEGDINIFSLETLVNMLVRAGLRVHVTVSEASALPQQSAPGTA